MLYQTTYFRLTISNNCIVLDNLDDEKEIILGIYNDRDTNFSNPIIERQLDSLTSLKDCISNEGLYKVRIQVVPDNYPICHQEEIEEYVYEMYNFYTFTYEFVKNITNSLCNCDNCNDNKQDDCRICKEDNTLKNRFNELIYYLFYIFLYYHFEDYSGFYKYIHEVLENGEVKFSSRFKKMFYLGKVRGVFELDEKSLYYFLSALYIYLSITEISNSDLSECIYDLFKPEKVEKCIINNGIDYEYLEQVFYEYNELGNTLLLTDNCSGLNICNELYYSMDDYELTKSQSKKNITFEINNLNNIPVIIIPKIWGNVLEILELDSNINVIEDFDKFNFSKYYAYIYKTNLSQGTYKFKIRYDE